MEVSCYIVVAVYVCLFYQSLSSFSFSNTFYFEIYAVGIPSLIKLHLFSIWNHVSVKKKKKDCWWFHSQYPITLAMFTWDRKFCVFLSSFWCFYVRILTSMLRTLLSLLCHWSHYAYGMKLVSKLLTNACTITMNLINVENVPVTGGCNKSHDSW